VSRPPGHPSFPAMSWVQRCRHRGALRLSVGLALAAAVVALVVAPLLGFDAFGSRTSRPYLPATGAPMLNFGEAPRPAAWFPIPVAPAKPPEVKPDEPVMAQARTRPGQADSPTETTEDVTGAPATTHLTPPSSEAAPRAPKVPPPLLPDDTRPRVRPEDLLPFFQFPTAAGAPAPAAAPTPGVLPPSSATFRQQ